MTVPYAFGSATSAIPLSQLDANFNTPITLGNTAIQLGNTVTTLNNMTLANVTISSGSVTLTSVTVTNANVTSALTLSGLTASTALALDASKNVVSVTNTGTGNNVLAGSPTLSGTVSAAAVTMSSDLTLNGGTANGVGYLNASKVLTTGSALTFDGTNLGIGTSSPGAKLEVRDTNATAIFSNSATRYGYVQWENTGGEFRIGTDGAFGLRFDTNAQRRMTLDSSGNLGLGVTPSAWGTAFSNRAIQVGPAGSISSLQAATDNNQTFFASNAYNIPGTGWKYLYSDFATQYRQYAGTHAWFTAPYGNAGDAITFTQAMTLDASGNLGVGTTSPSYDLQVGTYGTDADSTLALATSTTGTGSIRFGDGTSGTDANAGLIRYNHSDNSMVFWTSTTERARIDSSGTFRVKGAGTAGSTDAVQFDGSAPASAFLLYGNGQLQSSVVLAGSNLLYVNNSSATGYGISVQVNNNSSGTYRFFEGVDSGPTQRIAIYTNGDVKNTNNSYGALSDQKLKQDIVDAGSQWSDIKNLRIRKYRFKDKPDEALQIGLIAQEAEQVSPGLVVETPDEVRGEDGQISFTGETTKTLKYSVLYMKAVKALQEAMERIEALEAQVAQLKGA